MSAARQLITHPGSPFPLGLSFFGHDVNFALESQYAKSVSLCLFDRKTSALIAELVLSPEIHKTDSIWHIRVSDLNPEIAYSYRITPEINEKQEFILDPYAKSLSTTNKWGNSPYQPLGEIFDPPHFDWEEDSPPNIPLNDLIIYEMHVRAFTQDASSRTNAPGTFLGITEKIPHLIELGINAVELLPVQEFNECEYQLIHPNHKGHLYNFWGYSPVNFFSPMNRYATTSVPGAAITEFKTMVKKLHQYGIEVILDIVFNHTAEGGIDGPVLSLKGVDNAIYYLLDEKGNYLDYTGCGNTVSANAPQVIKMLIDCLHYWVKEMHVDGFRFDLASALTRDPKGIPLRLAPLIELITHDPILSKVKLIAEPWDAIGLYQVGNFAPETKRWSEWNGKYRDCIRRFIKGTPWTSGEFATRLCGSQDLYQGRSPCNSINFITAHDGFSLADLVSYHSKNNLNNGEDNRDGSNDNLSWNCGEEGPTTNKKIQHLRERQMKNFHLALMLSQGVPMLTMGDEYGHTKEGNNNTWCQDNQLNWFQWDRLKEQASFYRFYRLLINFRKKQPILRRISFLTNKDIEWHGIEPFQPDWNTDLRFVAFTLKDFFADHDLFVAFNAQDHTQQIYLPPPPYSKRWKWLINTAASSPGDIFENDEGAIISENFLKIIPFSAIVLKAF